MPLIFVLDNYDSFTYNLVQAVGKLGARVVVERNDGIEAKGILALEPDGIILSPGPGRPEDAGNMPQILGELIGKISILGVCLGHQMIGEHFGGKVVTARTLVHGKSSDVYHDGKTIFRDLPNPLQVGRYHSLALEEGSLPECFEVTCRTQDGEIMGIRHRKLPVEGVQFHPESILTPAGERILANFLRLVSETKRESVPVALVENTDAR